MIMNRQRAKAPSSSRAAHERALRLVPASGRVDDLVENVSRAVGRPVALLPFELGRSEPTGLWIATERADYVVFPSSATDAERAAIVCHELSHILLKHESVGEGAQLAQLASVVAPDISPSVAQRILARHGYAQEVEIEAETLATRLVARLATCAEQSRLAQDTVSSRLR